MLCANEGWVVLRHNLLSLYAVACLVSLLKHGLAHFLAQQVVLQELLVETYLVVQILLIRNIEILVESETFDSQRWVFVHQLNTFGEHVVCLVERVCIAIDRWTVVSIEVSLAAEVSTLVRLHGSRRERVEFLDIFDTSVVHVEKLVQILLLVGRVGGSEYQLLQNRSTTSVERSLCQWSLIHHIFPAVVRFSPAFCLVVFAEHTQVVQNFSTVISMTDAVVHLSAFILCHCRNGSRGNECDSKEIFQFHSLIQFMFSFFQFDWLQSYAKKWKCQAFFLLNYSARDVF